MKNWVLFLLFSLCVPLPASHSETLVTKNFQGEWVEIDSEEWGKGKNPIGFTPKGIDLGYTVNHNDGGTGFGFDDPVYGPARIATVIAVLDYIDSILLDSGQVDVEFNRSENVGFNTPLASAGPFFPTGPAGIEPGRAFTHIKTGIDPSPSTPDLQVTVDFGYPFNSETDDPLPGEFDLFTLLIHEITHGLGILTLIDPDGNSRVSGSNPGVFTTFDRLLETGGGQALVDANGNFLGEPSDLIGQEGGVFFLGALSNDLRGAPVGVLSPNPWRQGTSLSHWANTNPINSVMISGLPTGVKRRTYFPYEIGALHDLGYSVELPAEAFSSVESWARYP